MLVPIPAISEPFQDIAWKPKIPQQKNRSEFTGRTQTIGLPGAEQWLATVLAAPAGSAAEARAWRAFLMACRGSENFFHLPALTLRQSQALSPAITAAVSGNRAVVVSSSAAIGLGMYATVQQANGHHRLVVVVGVDGSTVHFEPYLSGDPALGTAFEIGEPYARVQLVSPEQALPAVFAPFQLEVEERL